jgi:hypothetical protein
VIAKPLLAVLAGVLAFLVSSLAHQFSRGFEDGVLVNGGGIATSVVGSGWGWLAGAAIFVIAVAAAIFVRRANRMWWVAFAVTVLALAVAGAVVRILVPADATQLPLALTWLLDGAAEPLTWAIAGVALLLGLTRRTATLP